MNIDGSRDFSDYWTGFIQFTPLEEKPPDGYLWSGWRLTRKQLTSRPDHLWPELWEKMGKNAKLKERQKWSHQKPKLDNARKLLRIYFIDLEDKDSRKPSRMLVRNWKHQWLPLCLARKARTVSITVNRDKSNKVKSKLACILEASESTRLRMGDSLPNHHKDHIAGKGDNSLQHYNLVHKSIPLHRDMKIPAAKAVDKEWEKLEKIPAWDLTKVRSKKEVIGEARNEGRKSSFRLNDGHVSFEKLLVGGKAPKIQRSSCTPR